MRRYERIIVFDLETTGLDFYANKIIELGAVVLEQNEEKKFIPVQEIDVLVNHGRPITQEIENITGITNQMILDNGIPAEEFNNILVDLFTRTDKLTLLMAYNSQFDMSFIQNTLNKFLGTVELVPHDIIDLLSMYRDGFSYPHRLSNAINTFGLNDVVKNSHRALDDAWAAWEVFKAMYQTPMTFGVKVFQPMMYLNAIGFKAKYGLNGIKFPQCSYYPISDKKYSLVEKHLRSMVE